MRPLRSERRVEWQRCWLALPATRHDSCAEAHSRSSGLHALCSVADRLCWAAAAWVSGAALASEVEAALTLSCSHSSSRRVVCCACVGKSALTIRLVTDNWLDEYDPTIEDSYRKPVILDSESAVLDILDTAGQEEFVSMQDSWMRDGKGFMLVYSITSRATFDEIESLYDKILRTKDAESVPV